MSYLEVSPRTDINRCNCFDSLWDLGSNISCYASAIHLRQSGFWISLVSPNRIAYDINKVFSSYLVERQSPSSVCYLQPTALCRITLPVTFFLPSTLQHPTFLSSDLYSPHLIVSSTSFTHRGNNNHRPVSICFRRLRADSFCVLHSNSFLSNNSTSFYCAETFSISRR